MKHLRRSTRYLWPYRRRLLLAFACVMVISLLWAVGLMSLLPALKVLISQEGLHGWAYRSMVNDRLAISTELRAGPKHLLPNGGQLLFVSEAADESPLAEEMWLLGLRATDRYEPMPGPALAERIALSEPGEELCLVAYDDGRRELAEIHTSVAPTSLLTGLLGRGVSLLPEPATYAERFGLLVWLLVFVMLVTLIRGLVRILHGYLTCSAVQRSITDIRCDTYSSTLSLPVTLFAREGYSDSISRFITDGSQVARGQLLLVGRMVLQPAKAVAALALAFWLSWKLALLAMIAGPPTVLMIRRLGKMIGRQSTRALESFSEILGILQETLGGIRVVKAYTMESSERKRFLRANVKLLTQSVKMMVLNCGTEVAVELMSTLAGAAAIGVAAYWIFHGHRGMEPEELFALMACLAAVLNSTRKLVKVVPQLQVADSAAKRVFELQDMPGETGTPSAPKLARHRESIVFEQVGFRYPGATRDALSGIELSVPSGQTIAIVGPNGSGKTTLASLLPRLIEPTSGRVLVDGNDISRYSLRSLRRQIALVPQETVIFQASVRENIAYGMRRPSDQQVLDAAKQAYVDEFVVDLPNGYDTVVGPNGWSLSGGQRQRIAIARAIVRQPAIFIFDEALSHVDAESAERIGLATAELVQSCTTFLIAHSFASIMWADRIVVMDEGEIIDSGSHEELMGRCQLYERLYTTQLNGVAKGVSSS